MSSATTTRDLDVLRTLLRVQLATTAALQSVYFPSLRLANRRLLVLSDRGFVARHRRGLSGGGDGDSSRWWRLTTTGLEQVIGAFPREPIPRNAINRVSTASLRNFEHRAATTELYLQFIADPKKSSREIQRRGSAVHWFSEYEYELEYQDLDGAEYVNRKIIPDAILETAAARVFIEIDRSTETHKRCHRAMTAYALHFTRGAYELRFADQRKPYVLYVTKSIRRAALLREVAKSVSGIDIVIHTSDVAATWLSDLTFGTATLPNISTAPQHVMSLLREVYEVARELTNHGLATGHVTGIPPCLHEAYALLQEPGR